MPQNVRRAIRLDVVFAHTAAVVSLDLCGNQISGAPRHRREVVPVTASARWRKSSLGKLETPVEVAWRYNRTDLFPLFAARGIEIPSGRPPQDLMESFISGMPTS